MEPEVFDPVSGKLVMTYQTFVVRTPHHTILVDTCTGEHKDLPAPFDFPGKERWREGLVALGIGLEDVDYVFCTHLHVDHTGWNTTLKDGRWVPTFPNAKYIFHKAEYAVWEEEYKQGRDSYDRIFRINCLPIVEAGQALLVDDDYALDDLVTLTPTPGHSPHHCCVNLHSAGQTAVVTGRHDAPPDSVPGAHLGRRTGLGPGPRHRVAPDLPGVGGRYRHIDPADPLRRPHGGCGHSRRTGPFPLQVQARLAPTKIVIASPQRGRGNPAAPP